MKDEKLTLLQKIRKLLNLADTSRGASEAEAENAMIRALELLTKHNLALGEVEALSEQSGPEIVHDQFYSKGGPMAMRWATDLGSAAAKLYFCHYIISRTTRTSPCGSKGWTGIYHQFVGRRDNVEAAKEVTEYLVATVLVLTREAVRRAHLEGRNRTRYERDFRRRDGDAALLAGGRYCRAGSGRHAVLEPTCVAEPQGNDRS